MAIMEENQGPRPMEKLAKILYTEVNKGEIVIPADKGKGFIKGMRPNEHMGILMANYQLYGEIPMQPSLPIFKIPDFSQARDVPSYLLFQFKNCLSTAGEGLEEPTVQVSTMNIFMENNLLDVHNRADVYITISSAFLMQQIPNYRESKLLEQIMENRQPRFFENCINSKQVALIREMEKSSDESIFRAYDVANKANELICQLLMSLCVRSEKTLYPVHPDDLQNIYKARNRMLSSLHTPPVLAQLAADAGMSESKFKRLFKQIFGDSVFHYYQLRRMQKAASLLDTGQYSVTEVGYRMGFTNLSHFSRQFEAIIGCKPKQYMKRN